MSLKTMENVVKMEKMQNVMANNQKSTEKLEKSRKKILSASDLGNGN